MKFLIMTDLEGAAGVDSFSQTRTTDETMKRPGMKQLALETNACAEGIRAVYPDAEVDVIDGHGNGGLYPEDLRGCRYIRYGNNFPHHSLSDYSALLFVGQHAMAGTIDAPLCHTYSSVRVQYYRLNGVYIGEFAAFSQWAGMHGVRTLFLAGDDKAALEAQMFIPGIETAVTKFGTGLESADHLSSADACRVIREGAERAVRRIGQFAPYVRFKAPFTFEARNHDPIPNPEVLSGKPGHLLVDERTYRIETSDYRQLPFF